MTWLKLVEWGVGMALGWKTLKMYEDVRVVLNWRWVKKGTK